MKGGSVRWIYPYLFLVRTKYLMIYATYDNLAIRTYINSASKLYFLNFNGNVYFKYFYNIKYVVANLEILYFILDIQR